MFRFQLFVSIRSRSGGTRQNGGMRRVSWVPFAVLSAADSVLAGSSNPLAGRARWTTKPLLMPALALRSGQIGVLGWAGLACSAVGDLALLDDSEPAFLVGLGSFLAAHACYITTFGRSGGLIGLRQEPWKAAPALGLTVWSALRLAPKAGGMRWPVTAYAVVIGSMAAVAAGTGRDSLTWGAASFCLSDLMLASAKFSGRPSATRFSLQKSAVMATYTVGQGLIITGLAKRGS